MPNISMDMTYAYFGAFCSILVNFGDPRPNFGIKLSLHLSEILFRCIENRGKGPNKTVASLFVAWICPYHPFWRILARLGGPRPNFGG